LALTPQLFQESGEFVFNLGKFDLRDHNKERGFVPQRFESLDFAFDIVEFVLADDNHESAFVSQLSQSNDDFVLDMCEFVLLANNKEDLFGERIRSTGLADGQCTGRMYWHHDFPYYLAL